MASMTLASAGKPPTLRTPMAQQFKILVADPIAEKGIELLKAEPSFSVEVKLGLKAEADFAGIGAAAGASRPPRRMPELDSERM